MPTIVSSDLQIAYEDSGPRDGPVVLLLHGWPDDATTWAEVAPVLNAAGLRTIAPFLRGFGAGRLSAGAPRTGNSGILAMDAIALLDAMQVERFSVAGHDWARTWPGRSPSDGRSGSGGSPCCRRRRG